MLVEPLEALVVPAVAEPDPQSSEELVEVAVPVDELVEPLDVVAVVAVLPSLEVPDELVETVEGVAALSVTTAVAAKQPVRARNEPALTTAAVRRAPRAGCGRRRRGRGAGFWGEVVASMDPTLRLEPVNRRRAAREVAPCGRVGRMVPGQGRTLGWSTVHNRLRSGAISEVGAPDG